MNWSLFLTTYSLIFLMELPDKTAISILMLSTKHHGVAVFLGAAVAFVIQSLVAVTFGSAIALLPEHWTHVVAGFLFLFFSFRMWQDSKQAEEEEGVKGSFSTFSRALWSSFLMIFIAEWGDLTQLATATLQARYREPVTIFISSVLALWSVTLLSILLGQRLKKWLNPTKLQLAGAAIFAVVGIYFLVSAVQPNLP